MSSRPSPIPTGRRLGVDGEKILWLPDEVLIVADIVLRQ